MRHKAGNNLGFVVFSLCALLLAFCTRVQAQSPKTHRVGVLVPGEAWYETVAGLRAGLLELGLQEGKDLTLLIRDWTGDAKKAEAAARFFEQEKVDLVYTTSTNSTIAARRATTSLPIVFCTGTDPVVVKLVDSFAKPGGRLTGVYEPVTDLTAKRLEILNEITPRLRRVITFYDPRRASSIESSKLARESAQRMGIQLIERHITSAEELQKKVQALKDGEADAYLAVSDPIASNQSQVIIDSALVKRLPTMFDFSIHVTKGGLASYTISLYEVGRLSAKYDQRVLTGTKPKDLPVQGVDKIELVINLKTAKQIGLTIPQSVLYRADKVIK
jgi:putative ABC transport system substrate-binding protein